MQITQAPPEYRPVTIVLETQDDYDKFEAIVEKVAGKGTYSAHLEVAAKDMLAKLATLKEE